jgi:hypothetical protein
VVGVVQIREEMGGPRDGVGLAGTGGVLDQVFPAGPSSRTVATSFRVASNWWKRGKMIVSICFFSFRWAIR